MDAPNTPTESLRRDRYGAPIESHIWDHYVLELQLAERLLNSERSERIGGGLYTEVYDTLFKSVPLHPQNRKRAEDLNADRARRASILRAVVPAGAAFLEVGAGDGRLSLDLLGHVSQAHAVDVSEQVLAEEHAREGFHFHISDGVSMPLPEGSIDFAYSNQLIEHLHPDDAVEQLSEIFRVLKPGGDYLCVTPNRLSGPHDISDLRHETSCGLHLQEFGCRSLAALMERAGFMNIRLLVGKKRGAEISVAHGALREDIYKAMRAVLGERRARTNPIGLRLVNLQMLATKP
ncbi:MAG: class I SAM-dependent methyltransferase [Pseudomonadota bacterium]